MATLEPCDYCAGAGGGYRTHHFFPYEEIQVYEKCPKCHGSKTQPAATRCRVMEAADIGVSR